MIWGVYKRSTLFFSFALHIGVCCIFNCLLKVCFKTSKWDFLNLNEIVPATGFQKLKYVHLFCDLELKWGFLALKDSKVGCLFHIWNGEGGHLLLKRDELNRKHSRDSVNLYKSKVEEVLITVLKRRFYFLPKWTWMWQFVLMPNLLGENLLIFCFSFFS